MSSESLDMVVTFPGGRKVDARIKGFTIKTDQPVDEGGEGSAPEPFVLLLASIGTCAGIYVHAFCAARNIPTDDIRLIQRHEFNPEKHRLEKLSLEILVPP
ncbi:MAG: OsmC family protein, partial [Pseudomonadota bacterium]